MEPKYHSAFYGSYEQVDKICKELEQQGFRVKISWQKTFDDSFCRYDIFGY